MLCDQCKKNEAVMRYTVVKDGKSEEHHLCAGCASEKGLAGQLGAAISSLSYLLDDMVKETTEPGSRGMSCRACGLTLSQFRQTGRLGCGGCYQAFAPLLRRMIRQVQGSGRHLGKSKPRPAAPPKPGPEGSMESLKAELVQAVRHEEFELAASLRDRIKAMEAVGDEPAP